MKGFADNKLTVDWTLMKMSRKDCGKRRKMLVTRLFFLCHKFSIGIVKTQNCVEEG